MASNNLVAVILLLSLFVLALSGEAYNFKYAPPPEESKVAQVAPINEEANVQIPTINAIVQPNIPEAQSVIEASNVAQLANAAEGANAQTPNAVNVPNIVQDPSIPVVPNVEATIVPNVQTPIVSELPKAEATVVPNVQAPIVPEVPKVEATTVPNVQAPIVPEVPKVEATTVPNVQAPIVPEVPKAEATIVPHVEAPIVPEVPKVEAPVIPEEPKADAPNVAIVPNVQAPSVAEGTSIAQAPTVAEESTIAQAPSQVPNVASAPEASPIDSPTLELPGSEGFVSFMPTFEFNVPKDEQQKDSKFLQSNMVVTADKVEQFTTSVVAKRLQDPNLDKATKECLEECKEVYESAVDALKKSLEDIEAGDFFKANVDVSAFSTNIDTCDDCFGGSIDPEYQKFDEWAKGVANNCLDRLVKYTS